MINKILTFGGIFNRIREQMANNLEILVYYSNINLLQSFWIANNNCR